MADRIMQRYSQKEGLKNKILHFLNLGGIINCYIKSLRYVAYYQNIGGRSSLAYFY